MVKSMTPEAWQRLEQLARRDGLSDAQVAGLAIGCPRHGNARMDYDGEGVFCHRCDTETAAYELGEEHRFHGGGWDMWDGGDVALMDYLAQTEPTTELNAAHRMSLCEAYLSGLGGAR